MKILQKRRCLLLIVTASLLLSLSACKAISGTTSETIKTPTTAATAVPTATPTIELTNLPATESSVVLTTAPTTVPTTKQEVVTIVKPISKPTTAPTVEPTTVPTTKPKVITIVKPTTAPTTNPITQPTVMPPQITDQQLKQDYFDYKLSRNPDHDCTLEDIQLTICCQLDAGCALLIGCKHSYLNNKDPYAALDKPLQYELAELDFYLPQSWFIDFWKDGDFYSLRDAYGYYNLLTYEDLRTIWHGYNTQFPKAYEYWKQANPGLTEPPRLTSPFQYSINSDEATCTITGTGYYNDVNAVIPETIDGYTVTAIQSLGDSYFTSIVMPDTVTSIGSKAFYHSSLRSVTFSQNLTSIGDGAFAHCHHLESVILPDSVTHIGDYAFRGCYDLTKVVLSKGLTAIPDSLFNVCSALTSIEIPESVTSIGDYAFAYCAALKQIAIPESVTSIAYSAFEKCTALETVQYNGTMDQWNAIVNHITWENPVTVQCTDGQILVQ